MSIRTLLIWIIIAGSLGGGVLAIRARHNAALLAAPAASTRTIGFDLAGTVELRRVVGSDRQILERDADQADLWMLHWALDGMDHAWEADPTIVRSGLRALATARVRVSDENLVEDSAGELVIVQRSGESIGIEFDRVSSGGYTAIRVEERDSEGVATRQWFGRVEKSVSDVFMGSSMLHWRSDRLFPMSNSSVRSIGLIAGGSSVSLERSSSGWMLSAPYVLHGERTKIEELVNVVLSLKAESFVDDEIDPKTSGLDAPIATITVENSEGTTTLRVGTRADVGGDSVYGRLDTASGSALITLGTGQLGKLTAEPEAYIGRTASGASATQIKGVRILGKDAVARFEATRSGGDWMIDGAPGDSVRRDAIERLIGVLARDEAQVVRVLDRTQVPAALGYIELLGEGGMVLGRFGVALDSTDAGMRLVLTQAVDEQRVVMWAASSDDAAASGAWLTVVAGKRINQPTD